MLARQALFHLGDPHARAARLKISQCTETEDCLLQAHPSIEVFEGSDECRVETGKSSRRETERREIFGDGLIVLDEECLAPARRRELVQLLVHVETGGGFLGIGDALDLVGGIVAELAAVAEDRALDAHGHRVIGIVGVDRDAVALFIGSMEELGNVAHLLVVLRHA